MEDVYTTPTGSVRFVDKYTEEGYRSCYNCGRVRQSTSVITEVRGKNKLPLLIKEDYSTSLLPLSKLQKNGCLIHLNLKRKLTAS